MEVIDALRPSPGTGCATSELSTAIGVQRDAQNRVTAIADADHNRLSHVTEESDSETHFEYTDHDPIITREKLATILSARLKSLKPTRRASFRRRDRANELETFQRMAIREESVEVLIGCLRNSRYACTRKLGNELDALNRGYDIPNEPLDDNELIERAMALMRRLGLEPEEDEPDTMGPELLEFR